MEFQSITKDFTTYEIGTVVRLKSGGPSMTVIGIVNEDAVKCLWWADGIYSDKVPPHVARSSNDVCGLS